MTDQIQPTNRGAAPPTPGQNGAPNGTGNGYPASVAAANSGTSGYSNGSPSGHPPAAPTNGGGVLTHSANNKPEDLRLTALANSAFMALSIVREIEEYASGLRQVPSIEDSLADARRIEAEIKKFGADGEAIKAALPGMPSDKRERILHLSSEMLMLRDKLRAEYFVTRANTHDERIIRYTTPTSTEDSDGQATAPKSLAELVATWQPQTELLKDADKPRVKSAIEKAVKIYVALWLAEQGAGTPPILTMSGNAMQDALTYAGKGLEEPQRREMEFASASIIARLVSESERRHMAIESARLLRRRAEIAAKHGANATPEGAARPLHELMGGDLFARLNQYYDGIEAGENTLVEHLRPEQRSLIAREFYELVSGYIMIAEQRYDGFNIHMLTIKGMEAEIVRTVCKRTELSSICDEALLAFRIFFWVEIQNMIGREPPSIEQLIPVQEIHRATGTSSLFIPYDPQSHDGMKELIATIKKLTLHTGRSNEVSLEDFVAQWTGGTSLTTIQNWGEFQSPGKTLSKEHESTIQDILTDSKAPWTRLVDEAEKNSQLYYLLIRYPKAGVDPVMWQGIVRSTEPAKLIELARSYTPDAFSSLPANMPTNFATTEGKRLFEVVIADAIARGFPEDVTSEPNRKDTLEVVSQLYLALNSWVSRYGFALDPMDFMSAAFVTIRRFARRAILDRSGRLSIGIPIPNFMMDVAYRNWGTSTFARMFDIMGVRDKVEAKAGTQAGQARGLVYHPEYRVLREYFTARGTQELNPEQLGLYHFASGLMRWFGYMDATFPEMYDETGVRIGTQKTDVRTRYTITLTESAERVAVATGTDRANRGQKKGDIDPKISGPKYTNLLTLVKNQLESLAAIPTEYGLQLTNAPEGLSLQGLIERTSELMRNHIEYQTSITMGRRSPSDIDRMRVFYKKVDAFARDILLLMRASGKMPTASGVPIPFIAVARMAEQEYDTPADGTVVVPTSDIVYAASGQAWEQTRISGLISLRIAVGRAKFEGLEVDSTTREGIAASVSRWWTANSQNTVSIDDFANLEAAPVAPKVQLPFRVATTRPAAARRITEPILPKGAPRWDEQFTQLVQEYSLPPIHTEAATLALRKYFANVPFYSTFDRDVLEAFLKSHLPEDNVVDFLEVARVLLGTIGAATGEERKIVVVAVTSDPEINQVATQAAAIYIFTESLSGEPIQIPLKHDPKLREAIEATAVKAHIKDSSKIQAIVNAAIEIIKRHVIDESRKPNGQSKPVTNLPTNGLGIRRFAAFLSGHEIAPSLRSAYFGLAPRLLSGDVVTRAEVEKELSVQGANGLVERDAGTLEGFVAHQLQDISQWDEMIEDRATGLAAYFSHKFKTNIVSASGMVIFAKRYIRERLLLGIPTNTLSISRELTGNGFAPYKAIQEGIARTQARVLADWLSYRLQSHMVSKIEDVELALEAKVADGSYVPENLEAFTADVLREAELTKEEFAGLKHRLVLVTEVAGKPAVGYVEEKIETTYDETIVPRQTAKNAEDERNRAAQDAALRAKEEKIKGLEAEIADFHARVMATSAHLVAPEAIAIMDEDAAKETLTATEAGLAIFTKLGTEPAAITRSSLVLWGMLGNEENREAERTKARIEFSTSGRKIEETIRKLNTQRDSAKARINEIRKEKDRARAIEAGNVVVKQATEKSDELAKATESVTTILRDADITPLITSLDGLIQDATRSEPITFKGFSQIAGAIGTARELVSSVRTTLGQARPALEKATRGASDLHDRLLNTISRLGDYAPSGWQTEADKLSTVMATARTQVKEIETRIGTLGGRVAAAKAAISQLEKQLEVKLPEGFPEPTNFATAKFVEDRIATDDGREHIQDNIQTDEGLLAFTDEHPRKGFNEQAKQFLVPIIDAHVLVVGAKTYLVSAKTAESVERWKANRGNRLELEDIFDTKIEIPKDMLGVGIVEPRTSLYETHPIRRLRGHLEVLRVRGPELEFVITIAKENRPLFFRLLATLAASGEADSRRVTRRFALANIAEIRKAFPEPAKVWFVEPKDAPQGYAPIYGAYYSLSEHAAMARLYRDLLENPENVILELDTGTGDVILGATSKGNADKIDADPYQEAMGYYNIRGAAERGSELIEAKQLGISRESGIKFKARRFDTNDPLHLRRLTAHFVIYAEPALAQLGWILLQRGRVGDYARTELENMVITGECRDIVKYLVLQNLAMLEWILEASGLAEASELDSKVSDDIFKKAMRSRNPSLSDSQLTTMAENTLIRKAHAAIIFLTDYAKTNGVKVTDIPDLSNYSNSPQYYAAIFQAAMVIGREYTKLRDDINRSLGVDPATLQRTLTTPIPTRQVTPVPLSPLERFREMAPELFYNPSGKIADFAERVMRGTADLGPTLRAFPEIKLAIMTMALLAGDVKIRYPEVYQWVVTHATITNDNDEVVRQLVDQELSPNMVAARRAIMRDPNSIFRREILEFNNPPWLARPKVPEGFVTVYDKEEELLPIADLGNRDISEKRITEQADKLMRIFKVAPSPELGKKLSGIVVAALDPASAEKIADRCREIFHTSGNHEAVVFLYRQLILRREEVFATIRANEVRQDSTEPSGGPKPPPAPSSGFPPPPPLAPVQGGAPLYGARYSLAEHAALGRLYTDLLTSPDRQILALSTGQILGSISAEDANTLRSNPNASLELRDMRDGNRSKTVKIDRFKFGYNVDVRFLFMGMPTDIPPLFHLRYLALLAHIFSHPYLVQLGYYMGQSGRITDYVRGKLNELVKIVVDNVRVRVALDKIQRNAISIDSLLRAGNIDEATRLENETVIPETTQDATDPMERLKEDAPELFTISDEMIRDIETRIEVLSDRERGAKVYETYLELRNTDAALRSVILTIMLAHPRFRDPSIRNNALSEALLLFDRNPNPADFKRELARLLLSPEVVSKRRRFLTEDTDAARKLGAASLPWLPVISSAQAAIEASLIKDDPAGELFPINDLTQTGKILEDYIKRQIDRHLEALGYSDELRKTAARDPIGAMVATLLRSGAPIADTFEKAAALTRFTEKNGMSDLYRILVLHRKYLFDALERREQMVASRTPPFGSPEGGGSPAPSVPPIAGSPSAPSTTPTTSASAPFRTPIPYVYAITDGYTSRLKSPKAPPYAHKKKTAPEEPTTLVVTPSGQIIFAPQPTTLRRSLVRRGK